MAEIKRKLATIRTIKSVDAIEGADSIVKLTFEGMSWVVVTNKDTNPQVGDKRVYFEIDSILPETEVFEFMRPFHFRVKTIKLRGQVSQGLSIPLSEFPGLIDRAEGDNTSPQDGEDVTDNLGVVKYELPESVTLSGDVYGNFPSFITKTDEERAQNLDNLEEILATKELTASVKVDGSSATFYYNRAFTQDVFPKYEDPHFGVCSRNLELKNTEGNALWKTARKYNLEQKMARYSIMRSKAGPFNFAIQGELAGPGIQNNRAKLLNVGLYIFNIQIINTGYRFTPQELEEAVFEMTGKDPEGLALQLAPRLGTFAPGHFKSIADLEAFSKGVTGLSDVAKADKEVQREGVVFRSTDGTVSFKYINPSYLLKWDL
jgi:RNA ligase (TIGR02306 family)